MGFYENFKSLCDVECVTSAQVRKDLGISQSTMASWKSRGLTPKYNTLKEIADYFGVDWQQLVSNETAVVLGASVLEEPNKRFSLGEKIELLASEKGWNLHKLAVKADVPYNTIYAAAKRKSNRLEYETLNKIAATLGVNPGELHSGSPRDLAGMTKDEDFFEIDAQGRAFLCAFYDLNKKGQELAIEYVQLLAENEKYLK